MKPNHEVYAKLRDKRRLSDYRVSKDTGIPASGLTKWKQGKEFPKADKLFTLAKYFGVDIEAFLKD